MNKESQQFGSEWVRQQDRRRGIAGRVVAGVLVLVGGLIGADRWVNRRGRR